VCLGIPMKVVATQGDRATVELGGVRREVGIQLIGQPAVGEYVIVHAGFAIEKLDEQEAQETLRLIEAVYQAAAEEASYAGA